MDRNPKTKRHIRKSLVQKEEIIDKKIVKEILDELKTTGCNLIKVECVSQKLNKNEKLLAQHHENVVNERKLFRKIGVPLTAKVIMKNGNVQCFQQALCAISSVNGYPLFTGVETMGRTDASLFTTHKKNLREGT